MTNDPENPARSVAENPARSVMVKVLLLITVIAVLLAAAFWYFTDARGKRDQTASRYNLMRIGLALHFYHDRYKQLPQGTLRDAQGNPYSSWRTSALGFVDRLTENDVQCRKQIVQEEPWNGPSNQALSNRPMQIYHSNFDPGPQSDTSYLAIVGPNSAFPNDPENPMGFAGIKDGTRNTILVIEVRNSKIAWNQPGDLTIDEAIDAIKNSPRPHINCLFGDGSVEAVSRETPANVLRSLMDVNDEHEQLKLEGLPFPKESENRKWLKK